MRNSSRLKVNLALLAKNWELIQKLASSNEVIFMVKSDAYGHGLVPIVKYASEQLGIKSFGCASLGEALSLRKELPHLKNEIFVFSDTELESSLWARSYVEYGIIPVLHQIEHVDIILGNEVFKNLPLVFKFNTGMNRLGMTKDQLPTLIEKLKRSGRKQIYHIMGHYSSSYLPHRSGDRSDQQYRVFREIKAELKAAGFSIEQSSMANSGAIEQKFSLEETHIRPGLMLYGPASLPSDANKNNWPFHCISTLESKFLSVREVTKGTPIGYGATPCPRDGVLAIVPLGYGDGILTSYAKCYLETEYGRAQIVGRVNMDLTYLLFEPEKRAVIQNGSHIALWDHNPLSVMSLADQIGTIPYQLFCAISIRVPRIYSLE